MTRPRPTVICAARDSVPKTPQRRPKCPSLRPPSAPTSHDARERSLGRRLPVPTDPVFGRAIPGMDGRARAGGAATTRSRPRWCRRPTNETRRSAARRFRIGLAVIVHGTRKRVGHRGGRRPEAGRVAAIARPRSLALIALTTPAAAHPAAIPASAASVGHRLPTGARITLHRASSRPVPPATRRSVRIVRLARRQDDAARDDRA